MAIVMFSLVGLPPLAGFQAKWIIFYALVQAQLWTLLLIGVAEHRAEPVLLSAGGAGDDLLARAALPRRAGDSA